MQCVGIKLFLRSRRQSQAMKNILMFASNIPSFEDTREGA